MERKLGGAERNYWLANQFSTNNVISVIKGGGKIDKENLRLILSAIQQRHPLLRCRVEADHNGENPRMLSTGENAIKLSILTLNHAALDNHTINREIETQLNTSLNYETGPLCRLQLIETKNDWCLIICCSHMITDATSVMLISKEILEGFRDLENQSTIFLSELPQLPALENCFPNRYRGIRTLPHILLSQLRIVLQQKKKKPARLVAEKEIPFDKRKNLFLQRELTAEKLVTLKSLCNMHKVSIHGILTAALALSVAKVLKSKDQLNSNSIGIGSPVDFRAELPIDVKEALGTYICTLFSFVDISLDEWQLAKAINHEIKFRHDNKEHFSSLNLLNWVAPKSEAKAIKLIEYIEKKGPGNICVSNIGAFPLEASYGSLTIESAEWFASLSVTGYLLMSVNTSLDTCHLNYTYINHIVSKDTVTEIADNVDRLLGQLIQQRKSTPTPCNLEELAL